MKLMPQRANVAGCFVALLLGCVVAACSSIGPVTVPRDRVDYITAVAESWKEQTLLNIVRMRYGDAPSFVDVSSIIGAYAVQGQLTAGAAISSNLTNTRWIACVTSLPGCRRVPLPGEGPVWDRWRPADPGGKLGHETLQETPRA